MEAPALALIPSGVKAGKVYSVLPNNGTGDFTFTRASEGTRIDENGLIDNQGIGIPRLDWGDGDCPSLLLEPQRTNEVIWSENFTQWVKSNLTVSSGQITTPDGGLNSHKILETAVNNFRFTYSNIITYPNAVGYSYSIFVKKLGRQYVGVQTLVNTVTGAVALFDLDTGSVAYTFQHGGHTVSGAKIENYGNDWYRISATFTGIAGQSIVFGLVTSDSLWLTGTAYNNPYLGDVNKGVYAFGAQAEEGIYPSSYINTKGTAVTRVKDFISGAGSGNLFNSLESTFFVEMASFLNDQTNINGIELSDSSGQNRITLQYDTINNQIRCDVRVLSSAQAIITTSSFNVTNFNKMAITYKTNEVKFYVNGNLIGTDTSVNSFTPGILTEVRSTIAGNSAGAFNLQAKIKDLRVYDRVLTEAEAIELTTL